MAYPQNPNPSPSKPQPQQQQQQDRNFPPLLPFPIPQTLAPNLRSFDSSVGLSRKAFRLGKFVQDLNYMRFANPSSSSALALALALTLFAYYGEGIYYYVEQLVWLSQMGLISSTHAKKLSEISAWAELIGYLGSISLNVRDSRELRLKLEVADGENERGKLKETGITVRVEFGDGTTTADHSSTHVISQAFPNTYGRPLAHFLRATAKIPDAQIIAEHPVIRVGVVFSGRQSPGGHNMIWGLHNAIKTHNLDSILIGFIEIEESYDGFYSARRSGV